MTHFHVAPFDHLAPGDNGVCRCADHAGPGARSMPACTYGCSMCERVAIIEKRITERNDGRARGDEEKVIKATKRAASIARGGCGCDAYTVRALKAMAKGA